MNKYIYIVLFFVNFFNESYADEVCGLPKPISLDITKKILNTEIKKSTVECLIKQENNPDAEYWLAIFIFNEKEMYKDDLLGFSYITKSADKGQVLGLNAMGNYYENGWFVEKNISTALKYYEMAAKKGNTDAMDNITKILLDSELVSDHIEGVYWAKKSAENGSKLALQNLGLIYSLGLGNEGIDYLKSFNYFLEAAPHGMVDSQANVGFLYASKIPKVPYDEKEAIFWTSQAVINGSINAYNTLGVLYYKGIGIDKNDEKAFHMFSLAAKENNIYAQINLAQFYDKGIGIEPNIKEATHWYKKAIDNIYLNKKNNYTKIEDLRNEIFKYINDKPNKNILKIDN